MLSTVHNVKYARHLNEKPLFFFLVDPRFYLKLPEGRNIQNVGITVLNILSITQVHYSVLLSLP